jgi:type IV secretion system protein VirD4
VTTLISNTKGEGKDSTEDFWVKAEKMLYQALVGYIWYEYDIEYQTMNTLVSMINQMEVREEDETFKNPIDLLFEELESKDEEHFAVRQYKKYKLAAGKTAKSILISCGARLAPFDIKEVRDMMSVDELELDKLGGYKETRKVLNKETGEYEDKVVQVKKQTINKKTGKVETKTEDKVIKRKTALFVIISDTDASFNFIVSLMYSQLFNLLCDKADNEFRGRLPVHVRCLLDEFANIGMIPNFEKLIATIRSREISVSVILQAESQLKAVYKDNTDTIIGNCDTQLFLGGKEKTTLESISKMLGKETIDSFNTSKSGGSQKSNSTSYQKMGRELMSMDEIAVMDGSMCILQIRGERPFLSKKYDIEGHKNCKLLSDYDPSRHLDVKKFLSTDPEEKEFNKGTVFVFDPGILEQAVKQNSK